MQLPFFQAPLTSELAFIVLRRDFLLWEYRQI